jgi:taurine dioxygenase
MDYAIDPKEDVMSTVLDRQQSPSTVHQELRVRRYKPLIGAVIWSITA